MTPDAHPIVGRVADGVYAACGFSGHGFMQSPAVGRALAELILRGESSLDLSPYALERFEAGAVFPEHARALDRGQASTTASATTARSRASSSTRLARREAGRELPVVAREPRAA